MYFYIGRSCVTKYIITNQQKRHLLVDKSLKNYVQKGLIHKSLISFAVIKHRVNLTWSSVIAIYLTWYSDCVIWYKFDLIFGLCNLIQILLDIRILLFATIWFDILILATIWPDIQTLLFDTYLTWYSDSVIWYIFDLILRLCYLLQFDLIFCYLLQFDLIFRLCYLIHVWPDIQTLPFDTYLT